MNVRRWRTLAGGSFMIAMAAALWCGCGDPEGPSKKAKSPAASQADPVKARTILHDGEKLLKKKKFAAAIERFRGIVIGFPDYPDVEKVLFNLAQAHVLAGNEAEARIYLDTLVTRHPNGAYVSRAQKTLGAITGEFESELGAHPD